MPKYSEGSIVTADQQKRRVRLARNRRRLERAFLAGDSEAAKRLADLGFKEQALYRDILKTNRRTNNAAFLAICFLTVEFLMGRGYAGQLLASTKDFLDLDIDDETANERIVVVTKVLPILGRGIKARTKRRIKTA